MDLAYEQACHSGHLTGVTFLTTAAAHGETGQSLYLQECAAGPKPVCLVYVVSYV